MSFIWKSSCVLHYHLKLAKYPISGCHHIPVWVVHHSLLPSANVSRALWYRLYSNTVYGTDTFKLRSIAAILANVYSHSWKECIASAWNARKHWYKVPPATLQVLSRENWIWYNKIVKLFVSGSSARGAGLLVTPDVLAKGNQIPCSQPQS